MNGLRKTLRASNICTNDGNLEELARDRNAWRRTVKKGILKAEDDYRMGLREKYLQAHRHTYILSPKKSITVIDSNTNL